MPISFKFVILVGTAFTMLSACSFPFYPLGQVEPLYASKPPLFEGETRAGKPITLIVEGVQSDGCWIPSHMDVKIDESARAITLSPFLVKPNRFSICAAGAFPAKVSNTVTIRTSGTYALNVKGYVDGVLQTLVTSLIVAE